MIRNTLQYVSYKDKKELAKDLKQIYQAPTEEIGYNNLIELEEKWSKRKVSLDNWVNNWDNIQPFFKYGPETRKIMYNTTHHLNFRSEYMNRPVLGIPQNTIEILRKYDFSFQKKFGQNFLIDPHVLDKIITAAQISKEDTVLEIGPGIGTMTQYLAETAGKVIAVEIDKNLIPILTDTLGGYENVQIINEDILKIDIN